MSTVCTRDITLRVCRVLRVWRVCGYTSRGETLHRFLLGFFANARFLIRPRSFSVRYYYYYNNNILFHCDFARILYFIIMYNDVVLCFLLGTAFEIRYRRLFVICSRTACCLHDWAWTRRKHLPFNNSHLSNRQTTLHMILLYFTNGIMSIGDDSR